MARTSSIYDQHRSSFPLVSAFVILKDGQKVATAAFKFPADGAGRLYCYLHVIGIPMVRGYAGGGGYDKTGASCEAAAERMVAPTEPEWAEHAEHVNAIKAALAKDEGHGWDRRLERAGYTILQAV